MRKPSWVEGVGVVVLSLVLGTAAGCSGEPVQSEADKQAQKEQQKAEVLANNAASKAANAVHSPRRSRKR